MRFERVFDAITKRPQTTTYALPALAICPMCHYHLIESTMIQLRKDAHELVFVNSDQVKAFMRNRKILRTRRAP